MNYKDLIYRGNGSYTKPTPQEVTFNAQTAVMEQIADDGEFCKGCEWNEVTKDPYGTGDSPSIRECTAHNPDDCVGVWDYYG